MVRDNILLQYACWKIISKYQDKNTGTVDGLVFNKMMSLLNHKLVDEVGLDIELPRCWYFYGEMVVPKELPHQVRFEGGDEVETKSVFKWSGESPETPPRKDKKRIDSKIDSLYSLFPPQRNIYDAVEEVYNYAPYDFQRAYKEFRSDYSLKSSVDISGAFRATTYYLSDFEKAMKKFPTKDFLELRVSAKKLELVVKTIFRDFPRENRFGIEMCIKFWEIFCKLLRASDKGHKYVSDHHVAYWYRKAQEDLLEYKKDLDLQISAILSQLKPQALSDPLLLSFLQPASLGQDFRDLSSKIDQYVYG